MDTSMATRTLMKRTNSKIDLTLDYHAHVLPGCDHGSDSVETSRKQLAMAAAARVRTVCATPHFYPHKESIPSFYSGGRPLPGSCAKSDGRRAAAPAWGGGADL